MRTTLDIDDDILEAAKELARRQNVSAGQLVSSLLRRALTGNTGQSMEPAASAEMPAVGGFRPFAAGQAAVSNDLVNRLREAEGI